MKNKTSGTSKLFAIFLAFLPLLSIYRVPGTSLAIATLLTALMLAYSIVPLFTRRQQVNIFILMPFALYIVYVMTKSTIQYAILCAAVLVLIFTICTGIVNERYLRKLIEGISVVGALCVLTQQILHITTGVHIQFYITSFLTDGMFDEYREAITTGMSKGMYRPSAFFMEPSHFTQYCMIGLGSSLFEKKINLAKALFISLGILATTSGMGMVATIAMWTWWGLVGRSTGNRKKVFIRMFGTVVFLIVAYYILDNISITHNAMERFTSDSNDNAITGRLFWWDTYFGKASFGDLLSGYGLEELPDERYFTGFMKQLYCYGIIGVSLLFLFLIILISISNNLGKGCCALYTGLLFFSELTGYHNLLFFIGLFLTLYVNKEFRHHSSLKNTELVSATVISPKI